MENQQVKMKKTKNERLVGREKEMKNDHNQEEEEQRPPVMALNHVSRLCRNVKESIDFYTKVLGMVLTKRPEAFDNFNGAWLFNYGVGIHLVQAKDGDRLPVKDHDLDPMDNHISFQCEDIKAMEHRLKEFNVKYMKRTVDDDKSGSIIDQLFFTDPDGFMIEICNCENIELVPTGSLDKLKLPRGRHHPPLRLENENEPTNDRSMKTN